MKTIQQAATASGVSVRTLHYYDEIGLLCPKTVTDAGYRFYDDENIKTLQQIMFFRELDFPLKDIKAILNHPAFHETDALSNHKKLLLLKRERLDTLIAMVDSALKGENRMNFEGFDKSKEEAYVKEVKERWGDTAAYQESVEKTAAYKKEDFDKINREAQKIYEGFAENLGGDPAGAPVQELVAKWQNFISKYYYLCTKEILAGLGEMYVADARFTENIDRHGNGVAQLMSDAIKIYCK